MVDVFPIKTEADYEAALARAEELMEAEAGTPAAEELEVLAMLIEVYEEKHHAIDLPDPIAAVSSEWSRRGCRRRISDRSSARNVPCNGTVPRG